MPASLIAEITRQTTKKNHPTTIGTISPKKTRPELARPWKNTNAMAKERLGRCTQSMYVRKGTWRHLSRNAKIRQGSDRNIHGG